ncbi:kinase-like protein, partial [Hesseltinella vesiculosa]
FNIIIQTPQTTVSIIRYPSDFIDFHQKVRTHYPRTKLRLPVFTTPTRQQRKWGERVAEMKRWMLQRKRGNANAIEAYLHSCLCHPVLSISTLLRDFLAVQRLDDRLVDTPDTSSSIVASTKSYKLTVDQFQLMNVIGKGCMGKVLLVESKLACEPRTKHPRYYALKVINKHRVIQQNEVKHIKSECDILSRLRDHPFLIQLHYAFQSRHHLYLVLDFIPGGDMATQISLRISFPKLATRFYAAEVLLGLSVLHSHGIIYRQRMDLKPENILIGRDGHILLTDFGLSKVFTPNDQRDLGQPMTKTFCGTAEYLAPEVLLGEPYTYTMDFWSLGILVYEMIVGSVNFLLQLIWDTHSFDNGLSAATFLG